MNMIAPTSAATPGTARSAAVPRLAAAMTIEARAPALAAAALARIFGAAAQGASRTAEAPSCTGLPDSKDWETTP